MIEPKHPGVKPGDQVRLQSGEAVTVVSRRSQDTLRVRYADGREDSVTEWEPA